MTLREVRLADTTPRVLLIHVDKRAREVAHDAVVEPSAALADGRREPADGVAVDAREPLRGAHAVAVHERREHFEALLGREDVHGVPISGGTRYPPRWEHGRRDPLGFWTRARLQPCAGLFV